MNKQEPRVEEVREAIAQLSVCHDTTEGYGFNLMDKDIEQILSIKDKDGKPMLGIISDDQRLPKLPKDYHSEMIIKGKIGYLLTGEGTAYLECQQDMLASNFRKLIIVEAH